MEHNQGDTSLEINNLSEDIFDQLLGDSPSDSTVNHNSIIGGTKPREEEKKETVEVKEETKEEEVVEEKSEESDSEEAIGEDEDDDNSSMESIDTEEFFKAQYQGLVDRGIWFPLEDEDLKDFKWNEEGYGKLIELQAEWIVEEKFNEKIESTGQYGKAIFDHIMKGGNPEDVVNLFKEVQQNNNFDLTTKEGKKGLLAKYYTEDKKWSPERFNRYYDKLVDTETLDDEIKDVQKDLHDSMQERLEETKKRQEENLRKQKEIEENFAKNMQNVVGSRKDITSKEKQEILNNLLVYDQKFPDGRQVNKFTIDFMKLQSDPDKYIDLVLFVKNPEKYIQKISTESENKANKKAWSLIKGSGSLNRNSGTKEIVNKPSNKKDLVIDYKSILDNR